MKPNPALSRRAAVVTGMVTGMLATRPAQAQAGARTSEAAIRVDSAVTTLVNTLTVAPADMPKLLDILNDGIDTLFSKMPGWISTSLIKARSDKQVIVYSQWRDPKDIEAFRKDPRFGPYFQRLSALSTLEVLLGDVTYCLRA